MSENFPWYDSFWLTSYASATRYINQQHPDRLREFVHAFDVLRTDPNFQTRRIEDACLPAITLASKNSSQRSRIVTSKSTRFYALDGRSFMTMRFA
jgi:hypothetical protein